MDMVASVAAVMSPVLLLALAGFAWHRLNLPFDEASIGRLVIDLCTPALIITVLSQAAMPVGAFFGFAAQVLLALLLMGLVAWPLAQRHADRCMHWVSLVFPNTANMGLPLCLLAFGTEGLLYATVYYTVLSLVHFTLGVGLVAERKGLLRTLLVTPLIWATVIGFGLMLTQTRLPIWLYNTLDLIGQPAVPLMLFTLGISLGKLPWRQLGWRLDLGLERLLVGVVGMVGLLLLTSPQGVARGVLILQTLMPSAIFNYLLAVRYARHRDVVTAVVAWSTVLFCLALPIILGFLL